MELRAFELDNQSSNGYAHIIQNLHGVHLLRKTLYQTTALSIHLGPFPEHTHANHSNDHGGKRDHDLAEGCRLE